MSRSEHMEFKACERCGKDRALIDWWDMTDGMGIVVRSIAKYAECDCESFHCVLCGRYLIELDPEYGGGGRCPDDFCAVGGLTAPLQPAMFKRTGPDRDLRAPRIPTSTSKR